MKKRYVSNLSMATTADRAKINSITNDLNELTDYIRRFNEGCQENIDELEGQLREYQKVIEGRTLTPELQEKYAQLNIQIEENIRVIRERLNTNVAGLDFIDRTDSLLEKTKLIKKLEERLNGYTTRE